MTIKVLSLGWGVQSWTLAAMAALGELDPVDFAVHADTTWERKQTYEFAARWTPWLEERGVKVITVRDADQAAAVTTLKTDIPAFTVDAANDIEGQLRRQCTGRWKITPMRRHIAAELERRSLNKTPGVVEQWLGISEDEWHRAKDSDVKYINHRYPLLEKGMRRGDCVTWLERNGLEVPGKSACVFCPYHNRLAWEEMKRNEPEDWAVAVEIDLQIRNVRPPYPLFVHTARVPLEEAVSIPEDNGYQQPGLFDAECDSGHCFL
jgi:hypothetical protein